MSHQIERAFPSSLPKTTEKQANDRLERNNVSNKPSPAEGQRACDEWNARWKVGQTVRLRNGIETKTRSLAWMIGGHTACVMVDVEGPGCYTLESLTPVVKEAA